MGQGLTNNKTSYYIWSCIILFCMFGFRFLPVIEPITPIGMQVLGVFFGMIIGWTTVGILWPSVLGIIALGFTGYTTPLAAFQTAVTNVNVIYVMFLFVFVGFLKQSGIVEWIASKLINLKIAKGRPWVLSFLLLQTSCIISAIVDPFSAVLLVWEIFYAICKAVNLKGENKFVRYNIAGVLLGMACGSGIFYFKFPFVLLASTYATVSSTVLNPVHWMLYFFILGETTIILYWLFGKYILRCDVEKFKAIDINEIVKKEKLSTYQYVVFCVLVVYMIAMLLPSFLPASWVLAQVLSGLGNAGITAIACIFLAFWNFKEGLSFNEAAKSSFSWDLYFIVAAAILIASALTDASTGVNAFLVQNLQPVLASAGTAVFMIGIVAIAGFLTGIMNSIVVGMIFSQIAYSVAIGLGINHFIVGYAVLFVVNFAFITPAGSSLAPLYFGRPEWMGNAKNATIYGLILTVMGILVTLAVGTPVGMLIFN